MVLVLAVFLLQRCMNLLYGSYMPSSPLGVYKPLHNKVALSIYSLPSTVITCMYTQGKGSQAYTCICEVFLYTQETIVVLEEFGRGYFAVCLPSQLPN